jgi:hypothetical protein
MPYSDEEIIAAIREDAFQGIVKASVLKDKPELRKGFREHFEAVLKLIDDA